MEKVIVIVGSTATGKSSLAIKLAKELDGEVISADSRQVYKSMDIGTGKVTHEEMQGIPHHLLGIIEPTQNFSVAKYKKLAEQKIDEVLKRGKIPIICGGTGFYIDAVTKGLVLPEVPPNTELREKLRSKDSTELLEMLKELDQDRAGNMNASDQKNKVRLIRAIEVAKALSVVPKITKGNPMYDFIKIGVKLPENKLKTKIQKRVKQMFKDGLLDEIEKLKENKVTEERLREFGFEYWKPTEESVIKESLKYAKRQRTWWKKDKEIIWFDLSQTRFKEILNHTNKILH